MASVRKRALSEGDNKANLQPNKRRVCGNDHTSQVGNISTITWSSRFGSSCLFGLVGSPAKTTRVALFDLDGTLIKTKSGHRNAIDRDDWKWFSPTVPTKLRELSSDGYSIFITSNQACPRIRDAVEYYDEWKNKLEQVARKLDGVNFCILAATQKDIYRKPLPGMWYGIQDLLKEEGLEVDTENSFFVGDAAGREKARYKDGETRDRDDADTDAKFAQNIHLKFHTPEEYFLGEPVAPRILKGFHPSQLRQNGIIFLPSSSPLVPTSKRKKLYMVLLVGYPGVGKKKLYKKYFSPVGYVYVDKPGMGDCFTVIDEAITAGKSVVVGSCTQTKSDREDYLDYARKMKMEPRCITLGDYYLAQHNNIYRAFCRSDALKQIEGEKGLLSPNYFRDFKAKFEEPQKDEGFKDIKKVFWQFDGSEEDRKRYMMWLEF